MMPCQPMMVMGPERVLRVAMSDTYTELAFFCPCSHAQRGNYLIGKSSTCVKHAAIHSKMVRIPPLHPKAEIPAISLSFPYLRPICTCFVFNIASKLAHGVLARPKKCILGIVCSYRLYKLYKNKKSVHKGKICKRAMGRGGEKRGGHRWGRCTVRWGKGRKGDNRLRLWGCAVMQDHRIIKETSDKWGEYLTCMATSHWTRREYESKEKQGGIR